VCVCVSIAPAAAAALAFAPLAMPSVLIENVLF